MEEVEEFIVKTIEHIVERSRYGAFRSEHQIQGYLEGRASEALSPNGWEYIPEKPTTVKYKGGPSKMLRQTDKGRFGRIDAVIIHGEACRVGMEIEYPRGKGKTDCSLFMNHIHNDALKLRNEKLDGRYLLIFTYHDLPEGVGEADILAEVAGIHLCLVRLAKQSEKARAKPVIRVIMSPEGWLSLKRE